MEMFDLECRYDRRKSFYGKATVAIEHGNTVLYSYNTKVAEIKGGELHVYNLCSMTTRRHVCEFARQNGFDYRNLKIGVHKNDNFS